MPSRNSLINRLKQLFESQKLTVLATQEPDHPYLSLMAFAFTDDLGSLIVATRRETRKYSNLMNRPGVSVLIDNRSNQENVFQNTLAVTGIGQAEEIEGEEKGLLKELFLQSHPELEAFVQSPECALIKITMDCYYIISQFQEVETLKMT